MVSLEAAAGNKPVGGLLAARAVGTELASFCGHDDDAGQYQNYVCAMDE